MVPIMAHVRRQALPLEELIHLELDQDLVPQPRACYAFRGKCLLSMASQGRKPIVGQRRAKRGQPPLVPRFALLVDLRIDPLSALIGQDLSQTTVWLTRKSPSVVLTSPATSPLLLQLHERGQLSCPGPKGHR